MSKGRRIIAQLTMEEAAVLRRFIGALTRGGAGGMPRPIEMHAHDPRRFIGDMLAWVHQVGCPYLLSVLLLPFHSGVVQDMEPVSSLRADVPHLFSGRLRARSSRSGDE